MVANHEKGQNTEKKLPVFLDFGQKFSIFAIETKEIIWKTAQNLVSSLIFIKY